MNKFKVGDQVVCINTQATWPIPLVLDGVYEIEGFEKLQEGVEYYLKGQPHYCWSEFRFTSYKGIK